MILAVVLALLFMASTFGWGAVVILIVTGIGYAGIVGEANGKYSPKGSLRPRSSSSRRRR